MLTLIFFFVAFSLNTAVATEYKEGVDYDIVAANKTTKSEIREFFSFFCSHCYSLRQGFREIAETFKEKAEFIENPVGLIGGDIGVQSQRAYAIALNLGIEREVEDEIFDMIHEKKVIPESNDFFIGIFESLGVSKESYEKDYTSFVTTAKVAEFDRKTKEFKIAAVPELVVNGKYLARTDNIENVDDYVGLITYLLTLP